MKLAVAVTLVSFGMIANIEARQSQRVVDLSGRWAASLQESVGPASLGGILEIHQATASIKIRRRISSDEWVTWSCGIGGAECRNQQDANSQPTLSTVERSGDQLIISTRTVSAENQPISVKRVLSLDRGHRLTVVTSTRGVELGGRTVYNFHGKASGR
jgi:hypothetical protein